MCRLIRATVAESTWATSAGFPVIIVTMTSYLAPLEAYESCDVHNSPRCQLFAAPGTFFRYDDGDGRGPYNCCLMCDPPLDEDEQEIKREFEAEL